MTTPHPTPDFEGSAASSPTGDPGIPLRCVECGKGWLTAAGQNLVCEACGTSFPRHRHRGTPVLISSRSPLNVSEILEQEVAAQEANLDVARKHWLTEGLSDLLADCKGKSLLNFGSGDGGDRLLLESQGYSVTTFDIYPGQYTDFVCDGHELPFADEQFDLVTSTAVFEHLYNPFQAASEIFRVLKPGGAHVGSAAFLEAYHANSYFHMSHLGLTEIFRRAGFRDVEVRPGWSFVESLNGRFWIWNRVRPIYRFTNRLNRLRYRIGMALWRRGYRLMGRPVPPELPLTFAGSLVFRAVK